MSLRLLRLVAFAGTIAVGILLQVSPPGLSQADPTPGTTVTPSAATTTTAVLIHIDGAIGPASAEFLRTSLAEAHARGAQILVLRINTPGGLLTSTRTMIRDILAAPLPVVGYVAPPGAHAASAGTFILFATHLAAMAPGTNLGAATPVQIGGGLPLPNSNDDGNRSRDDTSGTGPADGNDAQDGRSMPDPGDPDTLAAKAVNDAAAYIRSLAHLRGRNAEWAEDAVRTADSLTAGEALDRGVIDVVAANETELLSQIDGRTVQLGDRQVTLETEGMRLVEIEPTWRTRLLSVLTDPNVAFILMLIGIYGIIFELANPGAVVPGVIGATCLLLGLYALSVLPLSMAGIALLLLGLACLIAEAFLPSFGILGIGGAVAFALGATLLFDTDVPEFTIDLPIVLAGTGITAGAVLAILVFALRVQRRPITTGPEALIEADAQVVAWENGIGLVQVQGEMWQARGPDDLRPGQTVRVARKSGPILTLIPGEGPDEGPDGSAQKRT